VVQGRDTGCNSLKPPDTPESVDGVSVPVTTLDLFVRDAAISKVDFIKIDVEGAELDVFRGATRVLSASYRPIILSEVDDRRTRAWGYEGDELVRFLASLGFGWFRMLAEGRLEPLVGAYHGGGNMLAVPPERMESLRGLQ
jgi:hypothetical protein